MFKALKYEWLRILSNHLDWEFPNFVSLKITLTIGAVQGNITCSRSSSSQVSKACTQNKSQSRIVIPLLFARESSHLPLAPFLNQDPLLCQLLLPQPFTIPVSLTTHPKPRLGSRSSHPRANPCKSQDVFSPSLSKKLLYCMDWKPVQPPDTCMIFW